MTILECQDCGLVTLDSFDHINDGHYEEGGMHSSHGYIPTMKVQYVARTKGYVNIGT